MKRAIVTFAHGFYVQLLDISRPTFQHYAERHGYEYIEGMSYIDPIRPPTWSRILKLQRMLTKYDAVLWLGADVVIVDSSNDIAAEVPADAWQAMVPHYTPEGEIPNTDVWYVTRPMIPWLKQAWALHQYTHHCWWEQAAIMHLMGYDPTVRPVSVGRPSELRDRTHFLPLEWNSHESAQRHPSPRFAHATHGPAAWRLDVMNRYRQQADCT